MEIQCPDMRRVFILTLLLCVSSALIAQSDTAKPSSPSTGSAEPTTASQQPASPPPTKPGDSSHLVIRKFKEAEYPNVTRSERMQSKVWVHLIIDEAGDVVSADPISGEPSLLAAAITAMKQWKFEPYIQNGHAVRVSTKTYYDFGSVDKVRDEVELLPFAPTDRDDGSGTDAAQGTDSPGHPQPKRVQISQGVSQGLLIHKVVPVYPDDARRKRVQGTVVLKAIIGKDGLIKELQVESSPSPELSQAAKEAVEQWRFRPLTLGGEAVEIDTTIHLNFRLK